MTDALLFAAGRSQSPFPDRKPAEIGSWKDKYHSALGQVLFWESPLRQLWDPMGDVWISEPHFVCYFVCHVSQKQDCMVERGTGAAL